MFHAQRPSKAADPLDPSPIPPQNNSSSALSLSSLQKCFNGRYAVDSVSLEVPRGSIFGVIGRSGAGKSTLLRMACLLETPDSGEVRYGDSLVSGLSGQALIEERRRVGVVFQSFNLFSARSAGGNVAFPMEAAGKGKQEIRDRVRLLLELVGLSDKIDRPVSRLSGGERQRVAIARALANRPEILFCDEATSALDPETTRSILDLIADLKERLGLTVFMVTHQMEVVRRSCERVAVMDEGRLAEVAPVAELFSRPRSAAARRLVEELLPDEIREIEAEGDASAAGPLYRLRFASGAAESPLLSRLARAYPGLEANILAGTIHRARGSRSGELIIRFSSAAPEAASGEEVAAARAWLEERGVEVEEVSHD
jgi:D-methionine transport system ATP-binding protein